MLLLTVRVNEEVVLQIPGYDDVVIKLIAHDTWLNSPELRSKLGFTAPKEIKILRGKLA